MLPRALCFAASFVLAQGLVTILYRLLPNRLDVKTDIVGFPTYANFNVDHLFHWYYLQGFVFPLAAFGIWVWLERRFAPGQPSPSVRPEAPAREWSERLQSNLRALAVGLMVGLCFAPWRANRAEVFAWMVVGVTLAYYLAWNLGGRWLARARPRYSRVAWRALLNLVVLPFSPLVIFRASAATRVIEPSGLVREFPWFPLWLALITCGVAAALLWLRARRTPSETRWRDLEESGLLLLLVPILIFISWSTLKTQPRFDVFHDGETLVPPLLLSQGYFPWRDLIFTHGLLHDVLRSWVGYRLFDESFWGAEVGVSLLALPLWWASLYLFFQCVFRCNVLFLLAVALVPFSLPYFEHNHFRFLLQWIALLAQIGLWRKAGWGRAGLFAGLVVVQAIVTPESAYSVLALGAALLIFDLVHKDFTRSRQTLIWSVGLFIVFSCFLAYHGALGSFVEYYVYFVRGHRYTGGLPFGFGPEYLFYSYAPIAANSIFFFWFSSKVKARSRIALEDWAILSCALFSLLYYEKFLARADAHIYSVFCMSYPVILWVVFKALELADGAARPLAHVIARPATLVLLVGIFLSSAPSWKSRFLDLPSRHVLRASRSPWPRFGYFKVSEKTDQAIRKWEATLKGRLRSEDKVFDFSNSPGLMFYLLDMKPSTRFFHVSMAVRKQAQRAVISELERERPRLVIFSPPAELGPRSWDGIPEMVRHYEVAEYLFRHYRPMFSVDKGLVLERADSEGPLADEALHFLAPSCEWGYTPHFLTGWSEDRVSAHELKFRTRLRGNGYLTEIEVGDSNMQGARFLEFRFGTLYPDAFVLSDQKHQALRPIGFHTLARKDQVYRVPVSSCLQWHGFEGTRLHLTHSQPHDLVAVRLVE